jgi:magnesium transporter
LFAPRSAKLRDLMIRDPLRVRAQASLEELKEFFDEHNLYGVPVVDDERVLLGVVQRSAVEAAAERLATKQFLGFSGIVGGEEFRSMPLILRSRRRLSWLSINVVLNIIAASVIALYQDTLQAVIALAVFLPMISDMSGCSGNQAVAVSMRELTLGLIRPNELLRVLFKEVGVGVLNGLALGVLLGTVAASWRGNPFLGLVVGGALATNTVVAVTVGGVLPLVLRRLRLDPALVSGPVLTTVTDMCGFFCALSFATILLPKLTVM